MIDMPHGIHYCYLQFVDWSLRRKVLKFYAFCAMNGKQLQASSVLAGLHI